MKGGARVSKIKKLLLFFWNRFADLRIALRQKKLFRRDARYVRRHAPPQVLSIADTLDRVARDTLSVSRFGDGEIKLVAGLDISFQKHSPALAAALSDVLGSDDDGFLVCIPNVFGDRSYLLDAPDAHWRKHLSAFRPVWYDHLRPGKVYGNAFLSRCYINLRDKSACADYFRRMKQIWDGQDVLLLEGEKSRLGIGNDLFDNVRSLQRILGPVENAYAKYDALLEAARTHGKDKLILLALGPTASVMSYALFREGFRAVDLGHADVEYEWFLHGAQTRVPIRNKFVNEAGAGAGVGELDDETYQGQILLKIV